MELVLQLMGLLLIILGCKVLLKLGNFDKEYKKKYEKQLEKYTLELTGILKREGVEAKFLVTINGQQREISNSCCFEGLRGMRDGTEVKLHINPDNPNDFILEKSFNGAWNIKCNILLVGLALIFSGICIISKV